MMNGVDMRAALAQSSPAMTVLAYSAGLDSLFKTLSYSQDQSDLTAGVAGACGLLFWWVVSGVVVQRTSWPRARAFLGFGWLRSLPLCVVAVLAGLIPLGV
jgi:hypothetical protein